MTRGGLVFRMTRRGLAPRLPRSSTMTTGAMFAARSAGSNVSAIAGDDDHQPAASRYLPAAAVTLAGVTVAIRVPYEL